MRRTASSASGEIALAVLPSALRRAASATSASDEERPAGMRPARRLDDRARLAVGFIELGVAAISVGLEDPGIAGQMRLRMLAAAIARVIEHRRRRRRPGERPIVAHIDPTSPDVGLALGQDRHGGVVAVQALGGKHMGLDAPESGASTAQQPPTWSAKVDRLSGTPSRA